MDVASMTRQLREIVPQSEDVLEGAAIIGGVLFAHYLVDVKNEIRRYDLKGAPLGNVALPGIGSVVGFGGEQNDSERSAEHTDELQSLMRHSYAVFCLKTKTKT